MATVLAIDYQQLLTLSPNPYVVFDRDLRIVWMNDAYLRTTMRERAAITGVPLFDAFPSEPGTESNDLLRDSLERVLATGASDEIALIRYDIAGRDGSMDQRFWSATHTPLHDAQGRTEFILQHTVDVTELHKLRRLRDELGLVERANAVQARNQDLLAESVRLRNLFEQAPGFMAVLGGPDHEFQLANQAYRRLVGRPELVGKTVAQALPEVADQGFVKLLHQVRRDGQPCFGHAEKVVLETGTGAIEERYLDFIYQPIFDAGGAVTGVFVQGNDVTEEVELLHRQDLLINELNHRVKNTLAIVQGLASQSFRNIDGSGEARRSFDARLKALAAAHDLLTERNWRPTALADTIRIATTAATGFDAERVTLAGPDVPLGPRLAVSMAMTMHELSTNAVKYGALASPSGRITVTWTLEHVGGADVLTIDWVESGGPTVSPPGRRGFGTRLIEGGFAAEPGGNARIDYDPQGLRCRMGLSLPAQVEDAFADL